MQQKPRLMHCKVSCNLAYLSADAQWLNDSGNLNYTMTMTLFPLRGFLRAFIYGANQGEHADEPACPCYSTCLVLRAACPAPPPSLASCTLFQSNTWAAWACISH